MEGSNETKSVNDKKKGMWKKLLFSKRSNVSLEYIKPNLSKDGVKVRVSPLSEVVALGVGKWCNCLVGFFLGKKMSFYLVKNFVNRIWKRFVDVVVVSYGQGVYIHSFRMRWPTLMCCRGVQIQISDPVGGFSDLIRIFGSEQILIRIYMVSDFSDI